MIGGDFGAPVAVIVPRDEEIGGGFEDARTDVEGWPEDVAGIVHDGDSDAPEFSMFEFGRLVEDFAVDVSSDGDCRRDGFELPEDIWSADVAGMEDIVRVFEQVFERGMQVAVSV